MKTIPLPEHQAAHTPEETQLLHDLRVHQIELEMQNETLRESQVALDAARARYFDLYDLAPVGYCTVSEPGLILQANLTAAGLLGVARGVLLKQRFSRFILPEDQDRYYLHRKQLLEHHEPLSCELRMLRSDGSPLWVHLAATAALDDGAPVLRIVLTDISVRKQAEEARLKSGALQRAIFNSVNFSSIATDAQGLIQIFNVGAERMLGYTADEVVGKITPVDLSDPQEIIARAEGLSCELKTPISPGFEALVFKASRGIEDIYELTYIRKDGSRLSAVVSVTALRDAQADIIGYLLVGTDNTARMKVETERAQLDQALKERNVELEQAKVAAEKANLAKSDFLSSMSHELRTPLNAILGFGQLMEAGSPAPTPGQQRSINQILKAGWYLLELINEILDLAVIESGKVTLLLEPVALAEVLRECAAMIEPQAETCGIGMVFGKVDSAFLVNADRKRVKQVVINLLSNAIKYNKTGGSVRVSCTLRSPQVIRISVHDTGAGLDAEQLTQLFQPFNRLGQSTKSVEGTGIGLVVCKRLVELMGGVIGVESTVGAGSVFWVEFALAGQARAEQAAEAPALAPLQVDGDAPLHTLLYVEDNPANLLLIEDLIALRPDIRLLTAQDGEHGVELACALLPDVILMDISLPGISGVDALKILSQDPVTAHIPVLAISANALPLDIEKGLDAGFFRYLTKPIKVREFLETLDVALKLAKTDKATASTP